VNKLKCTQYLVIEDIYQKNKIHTLMIIEHVDKNIYKCHYEILNHPTINYYKADKFLTYGQISAMINEKKIKPIDDAKLAYLLLLQ